jgi:hypothetical protein
MAIKGTDKVTITLNRTTVKTLRQRKKGTPWDEYLLNATNRKCGVECMSCGRWLEANRTDTSQDTLARGNGWKSIVIYGEKTVGFLCDECAKVK